MSPVPTRIGPYRVERELARGGMGIVYLARDTRLDRAVALKALPDDFSSDPERLVRFEREAKVLASLNHPNIAGIHGVEKVEGRWYLALEYVEGSTLADRLVRGPLPPAETLEICLQIASGIEAAHESGVIHRDLKPGNVMVTSGDQVKVVDFGLAKGKVSERDPGTPDSPTVTESPALAYSPTMGGPATLPGVILGTAAYLSPEQARGKPVDRRTDIWSFGCVLYECLTGRRAFEGETVSDLIARILQTDVEWARLPKSTPPRLRELLGRCLEKDPRKRLRDMGEARLVLEEIRDGKGVALTPRAPSAGISPRAIAWVGLLGVIAGVTGIALWNGIGPGRGVWRDSHDVKRLSILLPNEIEHAIPGISADGRFLVVSGRPRTKPGEEPAQWRVYRRSINGFQWEVVEGSEGNGGLRVSPDGKWLYFYRQISDRATGWQLVKTPMGGGAAPVAVTNIDPAWGSACVLSNGDVLFATSRATEYVRVSGDRGSISKPIKFASADLEGGFGFPFTQPGDNDIFVTATSFRGGRYVRCIGMLSPKTGKVETLIRDGGLPNYSPTGHLLFSRGSTLLAVPFDLRRRKIRGQPVAILDGLRSGAAQPGYFFLSKTGILGFAPGGMTGLHRRVVLADGEGQTTEWNNERRAYNGAPAVSPGGKSLAISITNANGFDEIWVSTSPGTLARCVASAPEADCYAPVWSPDGASIAFLRKGSSAGDGVYIQRLDGGAPSRVCASDSLGTTYRPTSWSPDGSKLLVERVREGNSDICQVSPRAAPGTPATPTPVLDGPALESSARFSPDGRQIVFRSNESGREEIYVVALDAAGTPGHPMMVSAGGGSQRGSQPCWSRTGREIFYEDPTRRIVSVSISRLPALTVGRPASRWDLGQLGAPAWNSFYDIGPGDRLLFVRSGDEDGPVERIDIVLNFFEELKQKVRLTERR